MAWLGELTRGDKGPHATVANAVLAICNDAALAGLLAFDEFLQDPVILSPPPVPFDGGNPQPGPYPRPVTDADVTLIQGYLQRVCDIRISQSIAQQAVDTAAQQRRIHPVRDYLSSCKWDGVSRLDWWLVSAFGADDTDYTLAVGAKFLIAAVRRIRQPGCKFDYMPVFEGLTGIGKSTALRTLFGYHSDWFSDRCPADLSSTDAALALRGVWAIEFSEIEQIIRTDPKVVMAFLSCQVDRYRPPYGRRLITVPRQCVLMGTTNEADYLRNSTGNRRFWPVLCTKADHAWLLANRDQLWAEAAAREASKEVLWLSDPQTASDAVSIQAERHEADVWDDIIARFLSTRRHCSIAEVLEGPLQLFIGQQKKADQMRVASILKRLGWVRKTTRTQDGLSKIWTIRTDL
jgi:putative DNA primase/helicase